MGEFGDSPLGWTRFEFVHRFDQVGEPMLTEMSDYGPKWNGGFRFFDGYSHDGPLTIGGFDLFTTMPTWAMNDSLPDESGLWLEATITHMDESSLEGTFEGLVVATQTWEVSPKTMVALPVPLTNGSFRATMVNFAPTP